MATQAKHSKTYTTTLNLVMDTSFGVVRSENNVEVEVTVTAGFPNDPERGCFEVYDTETGGESWYAEGGLWFDGNKLTDYDGTFSLLAPVAETLKEWGYDLSEME